jgi:hypothetical protein
MKIDDHFDMDDNHENYTTTAEFVGRYEWNSLCVGTLEFRTNGHQGGDAGHGSFLTIDIQNHASTCLEVSTEGEEPKLVQRVTLRFRGDDELSHARDMFTFLAKELHKFMKS